MALRRKDRDVENGLPSYKWSSSSEGVGKKGSRGSPSKIKYMVLGFITFLPLNNNAIYIYMWITQNYHLIIMQYIYTCINISLLPMYKHLQHIHVSSQRNNKNPLFSHASYSDNLFFPLLVGLKPVKACNPAVTGVFCTSIAPSAQPQDVNAL